VISEERDRELRAQLAALYRQAPTVIGFTGTDSDPLWPIHSDSIAARCPGIETGLPAFFVAELDQRGLDLPLTQARVLMNEAASCFVVLAELTVLPSDATRLAGVAPIARSAAEKAATVHWVLAPEGEWPDPEDFVGRLTRSLVVEISGIEQLLRFYPEIQTREITTTLTEARRRLLEIAEQECGTVVRNYNDSLRSIAGVDMPSLTQRVSRASDRPAYAEQSAGTHPTGHIALVSSQTSVGQSGLAAFPARSTMHGEGRVTEPAVTAFGHATVDVGRLLWPVEHWLIKDWVVSILAVWNAWCTENGCVPPDSPR
jgi:hypothetical protein